MKWSWKIGEYQGITVKIHATFLLIIFWVGISYWSQRQSLADALYGIVFILAIFACVVFHEFGHALTARKYGIRTRDITLLPIGGVARLERMPDEPRQEFWVALAGPAVNVVIAGAIFIGLQITHTLDSRSGINLIGGNFLQQLMMVNIFLVLFNMIPAFPMDGGRVLRSLLAMRMGYTRATHIAATLGQGIALIFGFIGFFTNPFLIFIALFVWIGAAQEESMTQMRSAFEGIPVESAMMTDYRTLGPNDTLSRAMELILAGAQQDFPVVEDGRVVGILTRDALMAGLARNGMDTPVSRVMQTDFEVAHAGEMLQTAFSRLQGCNCRTMPVVKDNQLKGLLTLENVGEFMMIHSALQKSTRRR
ncbi:MAG: site-2 protease family protein [Calditrichaeota bacterium]|nr:MAG: site-2 protease family protein [Calditrichota bacterium]